MDIKKEKVIFRFDVLQDRGLTPAGLYHYLQELSFILKDQYTKIIPCKIDNLYSLDKILTLHSLFKDIKDIKGFDKHIVQYNKEQFGDTLFVGKLSQYLKPLVDDIELEPEIDDIASDPDLKLTVDGQSIIIECKNIATTKFINLEEHRNIFDKIKDYVTYPHQVTISYKNKPTDTEINNLGVRISSLLHKVTSSGNIMNNGAFIVNVEHRTGYNDKMLYGNFEMIFEDINSGERNPVHIFFENCKTIGIHGPEVDFGKILINKVKEAKKQYVPGEIFITAINTDRMLGKIENNIRSIESLFQPEINTRYSAVLLTSNSAFSGFKKPLLLRNPFATSPINRTIESLFDSDISNV